MTTDSQQEKKIGIKEHIDDNVNLYTVFGILNGLTIYSTTIQSSERIKSWLTFSFLSLSLMLWYAIKLNTSFKSGTFALKVYELLIDFVTLAMIGFWATQPKTNRAFFLFWVGLMFYSHIIGNMILPRILKIKWFAKIYNSFLFIHVIIFLVICATLSLFSVKYIEMAINYLISN